MENFAAFAEIKALNNEPVEVILLKESIAGDLVNIILSCCEIGFNFFRFFPVTADKIELNVFAGLGISVTRNVM